MKNGRPSIHSAELAAAICERLAAGESLLSICGEEGMPSRPTVHSWINENKDGFSAMYARAREVGLDVMADEILKISDDSTQDTMLTEGGEKPDSEWMARSKLRVDSRKWLLAKLAPKKYGERTAVELSGSLAIHDMTEDEIKAELAMLAAQGVPVPGVAPAAQDDGDSLV